MDYLLNSSMEVLDEDYQPKDTDIVVSLVTTEECEERYRSLPYYHVLARNMQNHNIRYCKAEMFKDCILGTLLIPNKKSISETILSISFYMNKNLLVLVDDSKHIQDILTLLEEGELLNCKTIAEFLCQLIGTLTLEDAVFLQELEQRMSDLEEGILKHTVSDSSTQLMHIRKRLLILHSYYQQLSDFCEDLEENSNHFFQAEECQIFSLYASRIERLYDHSQMLREYALQIREMEQSQTDARQNRTMRILTVVTTIFFPLSLITGWYGMNFSHMPELSAPHAYGILIGICAVIVLIEIWIFHKNDWFS